MRVLLVDTIPKNARNQGSINLGFEIVASKMAARVCGWWDKIDDIQSYDTIAFNVFYPMHMFNIGPFLFRNGIEPLKVNRKGIRVIVGGQGIGNNGILNDICDEVFVGEFDGDMVDASGFHRLSVIDSEYRIKGTKAVVELTRGCKYRCKFCEYGWVQGGKYREKPFEVVCRQLLGCRKQGIRNINFLSANFGGYSKVRDLISFCDKNGIRVMNSDTCLKDVDHVSGILDGAYIKLGVESFDEKTRIEMGKAIPDDELDRLIDMLLLHCSGIHIYLIYGMPGDDYERWFYWQKKLADKRKKIKDKSIRIEFSITNFEPCDGTPLRNMPVVNFEAKHEFLRRWAAGLIKHGYHQGTSVWYGNCGGRFGRKESSYRLLMALKKGGSELTEKLLTTYPSGIGRTIKDNLAERFFRTPTERKGKRVKR